MSTSHQLRQNYIGSQSNNVSPSRSLQLYSRYDTFINRHITYLLDLLNHYTPTRSLRSSSQLLLQTNPTRAVLSQRGFSSSAPRVWKSSPDKLRSCSTLDTFQRTLKTHLFSVAFDAQASYPRSRLAKLHMARDQPNSREKMHDFTIEFLKCAKFHGKFM